MLSQHELQETITDSLRKLGLQDQEIGLYLLSLKLGPTSIAVLAKHLSVSRPQAYKLIHALETHGLADFSSRKKFARHFMVESPSKLQTLLRKHQTLVTQTDQRLSWIMPDLLATYTQGSIPSTVRILQGKDQFLKAFFECAEESANKEIRVLGSATDFINFVSWAENRRWINLRVKLHTKLLALLFPSKDTDTLQVSDKTELRETRILKDIQPFSTLIMISGNKTILWQPHAPLAILIEDQYLREMYKHIFDRLWELAK
jgi:sugar-specific transcriptional regulator TrmB